MSKTESTEYEKQLALQALRKVKNTLLHDRLLHVVVILFVLGLSLTMYLQYITGSTGLDQGTVLAEDIEKSMSKDSYKSYTIAFIQEHNAFSFVSSEKVNIFLLEGNYTGTSNLSTILSQNFKEETKTNSWAYFFNQKATFTIIINNFNAKDILYSITIRDYTNAEYQKIVNRSIGGIVLYISFLPLIVYALVRIFKRYSIIPIIITIIAFFGFLSKKYDKEERLKENQSRGTLWNRRGK